MAQKTIETIEFTCLKCGTENAFTLPILIGANAILGTKSQVFRCKNCGAENTVKLPGDYWFPSEGNIARSVIGDDNNKR